MTEKFVVTREWIFKFKTPNGGYTNIQLNQIGERHPIMSGWMDRAVGKRITQEQREIFEAGAISKSRARKVRRWQQEQKREESRQKIAQEIAEALSKPRPDLKQKPKPAKPKSTITKSDRKNAWISSDGFLQSYEWRSVRMKVLVRDGAVCACCGATREDGVKLHVDHIKPRKLFPELALDLDNLQVLCEVCNHGKGNWDMTDWRKRNAPAEHG
jgi:5-methylcytosine-specific restriction endonuclease McrA